MWTTKKPVFWTGFLKFAIWGLYLAFTKPISQEATTIVLSFNKRTEHGRRGLLIAC